MTTKQATDKLFKARGVLEKHLDTYSGALLVFEQILGRVILTGFFPNQESLQRIFPNLTGVEVQVVWEAIEACHETPKAILAA